MVNAVPDLAPAVLRQHGIRAVMVDLDDTLVASNSPDITSSFHDWVVGLKTAGVPLLILSNGHPQRVRQWSQTLEVPGLALVGKPFWFAFRRGLALLGTKAHETAMVGDQLFTDVLGANLAGLVSVLVTPLSPGSLPHTRAARKLEAAILKRRSEWPFSL